MRIIYKMLSFYFIAHQLPEQKLTFLEIPLHIAVPRFSFANFPFFHTSSTFLFQVQQKSLVLQHPKESVVSQ